MRITAEDNCGDVTQYWKQAANQAKTEESLSQYLIFSILHHATNSSAVKSEETFRLRRLIIFGYRKSFKYRKAVPDGTQRNFSLHGRGTYHRAESRVRRDALRRRMVGLALRRVVVLCPCIHS
jgi:hypothetical protein